MRVENVSRRSRSLGLQSPRPFDLQSPRPFDFQSSRSLAPSGAGVEGGFR
jgi:hypothetical protein